MRKKYQEIPNSDFSSHPKSQSAVDLSFPNVLPRRHHLAVAALRRRHNATVPSRRHSVVFLLSSI